MRPVRHGEILLVILALAVSALWIDFSTIHRYQNSDSLVMVLTSLYRWTPLYWEQDRLGMLFPLLAMPWRDPLSNMLAQGAMTIFVGLSSFFLLGYYVAGRTLGIAIGAMAGIYLMVFLRSEQRFDCLIVQHHYATALAIGLLGLILLDRWARGGSRLAVAGGAACLMVAHWVNPGVAMALFPLLCVRGLCFRNLGTYFEHLDAARTVGTAEPPVPWTPRSESGSGLVVHWLRQAHPSKDEIVGLAAICVALAASMALSRVAAAPQPYRFLAFDQWMACAWTLWKNLNACFQNRWFRAIDVTALVGLATLCWPAGRKMARLSGSMAVGLLLAAAVQYAFMTSIDHVLANHSSRYVTIAVFFWQAALVGFAVLQVGAVLPVTVWSRRVPALLTLAMMVLAAAGHGWPSRGVVRGQIDQTLGRYTDDILAAECTHVTGDYWHVWSTMFHVNLRLADEHSPRLVWGIASRSLPTERRWRNIPEPEMRIAEIIGDEPQSAAFRQQYHLPEVLPRERVGTIRVLCPTSAERDSRIATMPSPPR